MHFLYGSNHNCCISFSIKCLVGFQTQIKETAVNVDEAARELPDANMVMLGSLSTLLKILKVYEFDNNFL